MSTAIVIGGGIGGLAAAIGLRRAGWDARVYERAPEMREVGAGISLWANGLAALRRLGLDAQVRALAMPDVEAGIRTSRGEVLLEASAATLRARYGELVVALHRADLQNALLDALGAEHVRVGAELARFEQDAGGVTALFADGSTARGDVLVGADGLWSVTRAQLHGARPPRYSGYTGWRAVIPMADVPLGGRPMPFGELMGRGARFGLVPLTGGRLYWFGTRNAAPDGRGPDGEKAELRRTFRDFIAPVPAVIEATEERLILRNDIVDRPPLARWGEGRVTLLGDAAHPMTPNLGQGACQALEDAAALAAALGPAGAGADVPRALEAYERRRRPRANGFVTQSLDAGRVGQWSHPLAVRVRAVLLKRMLPLVQPRLFAKVMAHGL